MMSVPQANEVTSHHEQDESVARWDGAIREAERVIGAWMPLAARAGVQLRSIPHFESLATDIMTSIQALQSAVVHAFCHGLPPRLVTAMDELVDHIMLQTARLTEMLEERSSI